jgi:hypothetical protein
MPVDMSVTPIRKIQFDSQTLWVGPVLTACAEQPVTDLAEALQRLKCGEQIPLPASGTFVWQVKMHLSAKVKMFN